MQEARKRYQTILDRMLRTGSFTLIKQEENCVWVKDGRNTSYVFRLLQDETERFQKEETAIEHAVITSFRKERENGSDEIEMEFQLKGQWFCLGFNINDLAVSSEIEMYLFVPDDDQYEGKSWVELEFSAETKEIFRRVINKLQQLIASMKTYRLYFATRTITFQDAAGNMDWLNKE